MDNDIEILSEITFKIEPIKEEPVDMAEDNLEYLSNFLPAPYDYEITQFSKGRNDNFDADIRANIFSKDDALSWLRQYEELNKLNFRVRTTFPHFNEDSPVIKFKIEYHCHHNTRGDLPSTKTKCPSSKHSKCRALLRIKIKNPNIKRTRDKHLPTHPCHIYIRHEHNHAIDCEDALRHRRPNLETERKMMELFASGHSPVTALEIMKYDLQELYGEDYFKYAADGAFCPPSKWAYYKYNTISKKGNKEPDGVEMIKSLENVIERYNSKCKTEAAKYYFEPGSKEVIVSVCTPLMRRVHENLKSSSETMVVEASVSKDEHCSRVFTFVSPSVAGALPLGVLILISESGDSFTKGLTLLKETLPTRAFFGNMQPYVIMTDDSESVRHSLYNAFPGSNLLLSKFHVLKAFWRFLAKAKNNVQREDRPAIFHRFQELFTCEGEIESQALFETISSSNVVQKYPKVVMYLKKMQTRVKEWMPAFTHHILTRGYNTNNLSDSNFRTITEKVLQSVEAYTVNQLFDFFTSRYNSFFERKLADFLGNKILNQVTSRYLISEEKLEKLKVTKLDEGIFLVKGLEKNVEYEVNTFLELCTCKVGDQGAPCRHKVAVSMKFGIVNNQLVLNNDVQEKSVLHKILTGSEEIIHEEWNNCINISTSTHLPLAGDENVDESDNEDFFSALASDVLDFNVEESTEANTVEEISQVENKLQGIFEKIKEGLSDPEIFSACRSFIENFEKIKTKSAFVSSLNCFGETQVVHKRRKYN